MTDTPTTPKPKRPARKRAAAPPKQAPSEFAGLSPTDCCTACNEKKCVISGVGVCSHPLKGGLQASLMADSDAVRRYGKAKNFLAHAKLDLTRG